MNPVKKKTVQIFANGSITTTQIFFKQYNKIKIYNKDHTTFSFNQKKSHIINDSKNSESFKTKYLKF
jgi:hypothetical protein